MEIPKMPEPRYKSAHVNDPKYFTCFCYYLPPTEAKRDVFVSLAETLKNPKLVNKQIARAKAGKKPYSKTTRMLMDKFNNLSATLNENTRHVRTKAHAFTDKTKTAFSEKFLTEKEPTKVAVDETTDESSAVKPSRTASLKKFFDRATDAINELKAKIKNPAESTTEAEKTAETGKAVGAEKTAAAGEAVGTEKTAGTEKKSTTEKTKAFFEKVKGKITNKGSESSFGAISPEGSKTETGDKAKTDAKVASPTEGTASAVVDESSTASAPASSEATSAPASSEATSAPSEATSAHSTEASSSETAPSTEASSSETAPSTEASSSETAPSTEAAETAPSTETSESGEATAKHAEASPAPGTDAPATETDKPSAEASAPADTKGKSESHEGASTESKVEADTKIKETTTPSGYKRIYKFVAPVSEKLANAKTRVKEYFADTKESKTWQRMASVKEKCKRSVYSLAGKLKLVTFHEVDYSAYGKKESRIKTDADEKDITESLRYFFNELDGISAPPADGSTGSAPAGATPSTDKEAER